MRTWTLSTLVACLTCTFAHADDFDDAHAAALAGNPPGVTVELGAPARIYELGQPIDVTLTFLNHGDARYLVREIEPEGRTFWRLEVHTDRPSRTVPVPAGGYIGILDGDPLEPATTARPGLVHRSIRLNDHVRFAGAGRHRLFLEVTWLSAHDDGEDVSTVTTALELELLPPTERSIDRALSDAETVVWDDAPEPSSETEAERHRALRRLEYFGTPEVLEFALTEQPRLRRSEFHALVDAVLDDRAVLRGLEECLQREDAHFSDLVFEAWCARMGVAHYLRGHLPYAHPEVERITQPAVAAMDDWPDEHLPLGLEILADPTVQSISPDLRRRLADGVLGWTVQQQRALLTSAWHTVRGPELVAPLRALARDGATPHVRAEALQGLADFDLAEATRQLLDDWNGPRVLPPRALRCLPPGEVAMDAELAEWLNEPYDPEVDAYELLNRHGSPALLDTVWACLERARREHPSAAAPLLRFVLRHDPERGLRVAEDLLDEGEVFTVAAAVRGLEGLEEVGERWIDHPDSAYAGALLLASSESTERLRALALSWLEDEATSLAGLCLLHELCERDAWGWDDWWTLLEESDSAEVRRMMRTELLYGPLTDADLARLRAAVRTDEERSQLAEWEAQRATMD